MEYHEKIVNKLCAQGKYNMMRLRGFGDLRIERLLIKQMFSCEFRIGSMGMASEFRASFCKTSFTTHMRCKFGNYIFKIWNELET